MRDWKKEAKKKTGKNGVAGSLRGSKGEGGGTKSDEGNNGGKFYGIASSGNCRVCTAEKDVEILKRGGARVVGEEGRGGARGWKLMPSREKLSEGCDGGLESNFSYIACSIFRREDTHTHTQSRIQSSSTREYFSSLDGFFNSTIVL